MPIERMTEDSRIYAKSMKRVKRVLDVSKKPRTRSYIRRKSGVGWSTVCRILEHLVQAGEVRKIAIDGLELFGSKETLEKHEVRVW